MGSELTEAERTQLSQAIKPDGYSDARVFAIVDRLLAARERQAARDALLGAAEAVEADAPDWDYADGVARDVHIRIAERIRLRADSETYREAAGRESGS